MSKSNSKIRFLLSGVAAWVVLTWYRLLFSFERFGWRVEDWAAEQICLLHGLDIDEDREARYSERWGKHGLSGMDTEATNESQTA